MKALWKRAVPMFLALALLAGCSAGTPLLRDAGASSQKDVDIPDGIYVDPFEMELADIENEITPMAGAPAALHDLLLPEASGMKTKKSSRAVIDYSNTKDGYVMVRCLSMGKALKVRVAGPSYEANGTEYFYDLPGGEWATYPLSDGSGGYTVTVYENVVDSKYAVLLGVSFNVALTDEFAPFIRPNQYVDYANAPDTVAMAAALANGETDPLKLVECVYDYVVKNFTYDHELAATVKSGYLPVLDNVLAAKKGICFDYAGLMTGMLRSLGVPCKLVVGYAGSVYHAWISVWSEESGWIEAAVYFDGHTWQRLDPTFASNGNSSDAIMEYIGNGSNYAAKYIY